MRMNTVHTEDVSGTVIGDYLIPYALFYNGRKQGKAFYMADDVSAKNKGEGIIAQYRKEFGDVFSVIYPNSGKWEIRKYMGD